MPLSELPMSILFLLFLGLFVLVGLYPAWKRTATKLKRLMRERTGEGVFMDDMGSGEEEVFSGQAAFAALDDFEIMVLRRLAQNGDKGLTVRQLDADLFLGKETVTGALQGLMKKGLVFVAISPLFRFRFYLSEPGRAYAIEHEFIPELHAAGDRSG